MIKKEEVERMADLARLNLSDKEKESLRGDLSDIIDYVDKLKEADVSGVASFDHSSVNITRDDIDENYEEKDELIDDFSEKEGRYLKVRQIL